MELKKKVAADIRNIFNAPSEDDAKRLLSQLLERYEKSAPRLIAWAEENISEGLTAFQLPAEHWRQIRTSNIFEPAHYMPNIVFVSR